MDHKDYRLAAIMYTDIVGFSRMMEKDETGTLKIMEFHNDLVKRQVASFNGHVIKTIGDAFLIEFANATSAVKCAIEVQRELESFNMTKPPTALVLRIGVHLGDIHFYENDALGEGINIASRLQSLCRPGRVCISGEVNNLVSNKIDVAIHPLGAVTLKNISKPLNAFEIMTNGAAEDLSELETLPAVAVDAKALESAQTKNVAAAPETASQVPAQKAASSPPGPIEPPGLRSFVLQLIKQAGRRLTVSEVRSRLPQNYQTEDSYAYLNTLSDSGFLVKAGEASPQPDTPRNDSGDYSDEERDFGPGHGNQWQSRLERNMERMSRRMDRHPRHYGGPGSEDMRDMAQDFKSEVVDRLRSGFENGFWTRKSPSFEQYMQNLDRRVDREKSGFRSHFTSYAFVNGLLWVIWLSTTPFGFVWPLIVTLSWGIGLASHWVNVRQRIRESRQLKAIPSLDQKQFGLVRKLFRERKGWNAHLVSNLATAVFLFVLNMITSPFVLWSLIPIAGMGIGVFAHLPAFKNKEQELLSQISQSGVSIDVLANAANLKDIKALPNSGVAAGPLAAEAEKIRQRILKQVKGIKGPNPLGDDFGKVLDNYVNQIRELSIRDREIDTIIATIPMRDLEREYANTEQELAKASDPRMSAEYQKALEQIRKQQKAYGEMESEQKVLKLRLSNAVNSMKQLEIDLARMRSLASGQEIGSAGAIKEKSSELSQYLSDLRAGYQEIDALDKGIFGTVSPPENTAEARKNDDPDKA